MLPGVRSAPTEEIDMTDEATREPEYRWPLEVRRAAAQAAVTASKKTGRPVHPDVKELADEADRLEGRIFVEEQPESVRQRIRRWLRQLLGVSE
jgi:hypothetical protein